MRSAQRSVVQQPAAGPAPHRELLGGVELQQCHPAEFLDVSVHAAAQASRRAPRRERERRRRQRPEGRSSRRCGKRAARPLTQSSLTAGTARCGLRDVPAASPPGQEDLPELCGRQCRHIRDPGDLFLDARLGRRLAAGRSSLENLSASQTQPGDGVDEYSMPWPIWATQVAELAVAAPVRLQGRVGRERPVGRDRARSPGPARPGRGRGLTDRRPIGVGPGRSPSRCRGILLALRTDRVDGRLWSR